MSTLEERVSSLEQRKPEIGPRGPAGNIDAAVAQAVEQAKRSVADAEQRFQTQAAAEFARFSAAVRQLRLDFEKLQTSLQATIKDAVENHTISVLQDYHVINDKCEPMHWNT